MKIIGIYTITCLVNNKIYVGKSTHVKNRLKEHKSKLKIQSDTIRRYCKDRPSKPRKNFKLSYIKLNNNLET